MSAPFANAGAAFASPGDTALPSARAKPSSAVNSHPNVFLLIPILLSFRFSRPPAPTPFNVPPFLSSPLIVSAFKNANRTLWKQSGCFHNLSDADARRGPPSLPRPSHAALWGGFSRPRGAAGRCGRRAGPARRHLPAWDVPAFHGLYLCLHIPRLPAHATPACTDRACLHPATNAAHPMTPACGRRSRTVSDSTSYWHGRPTTTFWPESRPVPTSKAPAPIRSEPRG